MLTLRFESDSRGSDPDTTFVVETSEFRTRREKDGSVNVLIPNENGVDIYHPLGFDVGSHDRCYVMNSAGATVARYLPSPAMAESAQDYPS
jgi:hypothetical protein